MKLEKNTLETTRLSDSKLLEEALEMKYFVDDDKEYDYEEIKNFSKKILGENYTDGKTAGAIRRLVEKSLIVRSDRGKYKKNIEEQCDKVIDISHVVTTNLETSITNIKQQLINLDVLSLNEIEFKVFSESKNLITLIEHKLKEINSINSKED